MVVSFLFIFSFDAFSKTGHWDVQARDLLAPARYYRILLSALAHDSIFHLALTVVSWLWVSDRLERRLGSVAYARWALFLC